MPQGQKRKFFQYSEENMQKALEAVRNGAGKRETCKNYGVPRTTLLGRLKAEFLAKSPKMGPDPYLNSENEKKLVTWILNLAKCGFPVRKNELLLTVQKIVLDEKIKTPFKDGKPGEKWYSSFLRRHPEISSRTAESINLSRAKITEEYIRSWFRELENYLESIGQTDILQYPGRIFNADESGFSLCPKTGRVLGPKGYKNVYEIKKGNEKDNITVLVTFSADGRMYPPCVVYPYVKPPKTIVDSLPLDWFLGKSDSGWMKSNVFYEYVANGMNTWIVEKNIKKPIIFFVDGHRSHLSMELSQFCDDNDIILYALPPNTTHILQPADVAVFKALKEDWRQAVRSWQKDNDGQLVTKANFAKIFEKALHSDKMPERIRNGFQRCGLFPYNPDAIDYTKCVQNTLEKLQVCKANEIENLSLTDFETTYRVLTTLKSNFVRKANDIDQLVEDLKEFQEKVLGNNSGADIQCYEVNDDGTLSLVETEGQSNASQNNIPNRENEIPSDVTQSLDDNNIMVLDQERNNLGFVRLESNFENSEMGTSDNLNKNLSNDNTLKLNSGNEINRIRIEDFKRPINVMTSTSFENSETDTGENLTEKSLPVGNAAEIISDNGINRIQKQEPSDVDSFKNHLKYPKPINKSERPRAGPSISAISASSWRAYYKGKENEKMEKEKKRREVSARRKSEKSLKTLKKSRNKNETISNAVEDMAKKKEKCGACTEELDSDAEDEGDKNVGCDMCSRWYHLKCTMFIGQTYEDVVHQEFYCDFCIDND